MNNGDYCVPGNAVPAVKNNFGNAVPRRSLWKRSLSQTEYIDDNVFPDNS